MISNGSGAEFIMHSVPLPGKVD